MGSEMCIRDRGYNIFKDPFVVFVVHFWLMVIGGLEKVLKKIVYFFDIWDYKTFSEGGNRISEEQIDLPSADVET